MRWLDSCRVTKMDYEPVNIAGLTYREKPMNIIKRIRLRILSWQIKQCMNRIDKLLTKKNKLGA